MFICHAHYVDIWSTKLAPGMTLHGKFLGALLKTCADGYFWKTQLKNLEISLGFCSHFYSVYPLSLQVYMETHNAHESVSYFMHY